MLLEWRLSKPFFKYLCILDLLIPSLLDTSSIVILCLRGMLRNRSKSKGVALRPHLPFFRLVSSTGIFLSKIGFTLLPYALD